MKLVDDLIHQSSTSVTEDIIFTYARQIWSGGIVFLVVAFLVWTGMGLWSYRNMNMNIRRTVSMINRDIVTVPRWKRHMPVLVALASTISNGPRFHHHEPDYSTTIRTKFTFARQMKLKMKEGRKVQYLVR